jgi:hypothetical protein
MGNQNSLIPVGTGLTKYDSDLKWCRTFSFSLAPPNIELHVKI